jgi:hypothetical protein
VNIRELDPSWRTYDGLATAGRVCDNHVRGTCLGIARVEVLVVKGSYSDRIDRIRETIEVALVTLQSADEHGQDRTEVGRLFT